MRRREALFGIGSIGAAFAAGCHGRGGTDVSGPSGSVGAQPVTVLSGRTDQPVPSLGGLTAGSGQSLFLQAAGFFALRTAFAGRSILLWPADDGFLSAHHTRSMVYSGKDPGTLSRLAPGVTSVSLVPDAGIRAFPWALERVTKGASTLSTSHPALDFTVDGGGFPITLKVNFADQAFIDNPRAAAAAYTYRDSSGVITKAEVVFQSLQIQGFWHSADNFETAVVHEVIHTTGLDHSTEDDPIGIMSNSGESYKFRAPTEQERLIMKMQYERLPGTTLAGMSEADPGVSARSADAGWHRVVCIH